MNRICNLGLIHYVLGLSLSFFISCKQIPEQVELGGHVWKTTNLQTFTYQNGDSIKLIIQDEFWQSETQGAFSKYNNSDSLANIYGLLFNWQAVNDPRGLCPKGWHVATAEEWQDLIDACGGKDKAAMRLKAKDYWIEQHEKILKYNAFRAIPGGNRKENGIFNGLGISGTFWSATETTQDTAWAFFMNSAHARVGSEAGHKLNALSCRCVLDYN